MTTSAEMCTNELFKESQTAEGLSKSELKELKELSFLATKDLNFTLYGTFY